MLDHLGLTIIDFDRSVAFFDRCLGAVGIRRLMTLIPGQYPGPTRIAGYGQSRPQFWIGERGQSFWTAAHQPAASPIHVAFTVESRALVHAFHATGLAAGGTDYGAPGLRPHYHPDYYGAFVLDLDGNNIEAVCHAPA